MCAPKSSPYFVSKINLTNPLLSLVAKALPLDLNENLPTAIFLPNLMARSSVRPKDPTCGWQYVQFGMLV